MIVTALNQELIPEVQQVLKLGTPFIRVRAYSDYWLYARLFASSCPVALVEGAVAGAVIAFRSQEDPNDVYVQDVMTHPDYRKRGVARALLADVRRQAVEWSCVRLYLTSEAENKVAHAAWTSMGFRNVQGDLEINGVSLIKDFKGPGKDRAVYELDLR
jgi:GNAT superfamily N-acetyltransferase